MGRRDEERLLRQRLLDAQATLAARQRSAGAKGQFQVVQVFDGGSIPTVVPKVFYTHPCTLTYPLTENADFTVTPNGAVTLPVVVLGPKVPIAGDNLIAAGLPYRWVAEQGHAPSTESVSTACCPGNPVPKVLTGSGPEFCNGPPTSTLTFTFAPSWSTPTWVACCTSISGVSEFFTFSCSLGFWGFTSFVVVDDETNDLTPGITCSQDLTHLPVGTHLTINAAFPTYDAFSRAAAAFPSR